MRRRFAPVDIFRILPYVWQKKMIESAKLKNDVPDKHEKILLYCVQLQNQIKNGDMKFKNSIIPTYNERCIIFLIISIKSCIPNKDVTFQSTCTLQYLF